MTGLILIVDDEQDLANTVEYNLEREGFRTVKAHTGRLALDLANRDPLPDLIVLDLMLPDISGLEVCRELRRSERTRQVPVLMLTAKGEEIDRVVGFEMGADDYITKPFSVRELLLRIKAVLRRIHGNETPSAQARERFGLLMVDGEAHRVWVGENEARLTALEFRLLSTFMSRKGRVQTRELLLSNVWGIQGDVTTRTVDTHVKRLREKLGEAGNYIETIRGVGYRFRTHPEEATACG